MPACASHREHLCSLRLVHSLGETATLSPHNDMVKMGPFLCPSFCAVVVFLVFFTLQTQHLSHPGPFTPRGT